MTVDTIARSRALLGQARLAQSVTVTWMVVEGGIAIGAGLAAHSVALTAFGVDSCVELFSSLVVLRRLFQRGVTEERGSRTVAERRASALVGYALYALIAYIVVSAAVSLALRVEPRGSSLGIAITIASLPVMAVLWRWRLGLAARLDSPALRADAACSVVCLYLAAVALVGLLLNQLFGLWWADPIAAIALVWWIRGEAAEALEAGRAPEDC